jgi:anionic cell wall polymer biosynthesis LytR-Cps2A-Psr (LCP) family protein
MNNRKFGLVVLAATLALALACGLFSSPSGTVKDFYKYTEKGDLDKAMNLMSKRMKTAMTPEKMKSVMALATEKIKQKRGISSVNIDKEDKTGDTATVSGSVKYGDGTTENYNQSLIKEDGSWKLDSK